MLISLSVNSLVWNGCLHFSGGASAKHAVVDKVGLTVGDSAKRSEEKGFRES